MGRYSINVFVVLLNLIDIYDNCKFFCVTKKFENIDILQIFARWLTKMQKFARNLKFGRQIMELRTKRTGTEFYASEQTVGTPPANGKWPTDQNITSL